MANLPCTDCCFGLRGDSSVCETCNGTGEVSPKKKVAIPPRRAVKGSHSTNDGPLRPFNLVVEGKMMATSTDDAIYRLKRHLEYCVMIMEGKPLPQGAESIFADGGEINLSDVADFGDSENQTVYYGVPDELME